MQVMVHRAVPLLLMELKRVLVPVLPAGMLLVTTAITTTTGSSSRALQEEGVCGWGRLCGAMLQFLMGIMEQVQQR